MNSEKSRKSGGDSDLIANLTPLDVALAEPQPGDWLFVHAEKGQSLAQYKAAKPVKTTQTQKTIHILPIGEFTPYEDSIIRYTSSYLQAFFGLKTTISDPLTDIRIVAAGRREFDGSEQLLTTTILNYLKTTMPDDAIVVLGITSIDLHGGEQTNFLFGQARTRQRVGVSSMFRYMDEPLDADNYNVCLERIIKTSAHEVSHMFSCQHCTHAVCLMNGSNSLSESDSRPNRLCSECHQKLQWNLEFDVVERDLKLHAFFLAHGLERDAELLGKELKLLK